MTAAEALAASDSTIAASEPQDRAAWVIQLAARLAALGAGLRQLGAEGRPFVAKLKPFVKNSLKLDGDTWKRAHTRAMDERVEPPGAGSGSGWETNPRHHSYAIRSITANTGPYPRLSF